jgi:hypothetical protein
MTPTRAGELAANLADVRERIAAACAAARRPAEEVELLAVTKTWPGADVALLWDLGLTWFAENRDQDAATKVAEFATLRPDATPRWSMVGQLQRNKARSVARWADEVQSVDSARLITALGKAAANAKAAGERQRPLDVLLQVSLDEDAGRGGCPPAEVPELADLIAHTGELRLKGLMHVAPLHGTADEAFATVAGIAERLRREHPEATVLSAGMSGDLESAISRGSTCVRVGTALLGERPLASPVRHSKNG